MDAFFYKLIYGIIDGLIISSVYALSAIGLSLVFGITRTFNFCHESFVTWGAYFAWLILNLTKNKLPYGIIIIFTIPIMYLIGYIFEKVAIRPLRKSTNWFTIVLIITLASAYAFDNCALIIFGPFVKTLPPLQQGVITFGKFAIKTNDLLVFIIALLIIFIVFIFLEKTREGMAMRAVAQDLIGSNIVGVYANRIFGYSLGISAVLAAIAGILLAPKYFISPGGGWSLYTKSFVIVFFGGLGSVKGTLGAAFILGMVEAMVVLLFGSTWVMPFWFILVITIMMFKPKGLFGIWE
jgi:branched-chain amino acid transport system permease protein